MGWAGLASRDHPHQGRVPGQQVQSPRPPAARGPSPQCPLVAHDSPDPGYPTKQRSCHLTLTPADFLGLELTKKNQLRQRIKGSVGIPFVSKGQRAAEK